MVQVIGAGLGRTGTNSLKIALEKLLGGPCYHMFELIGRPEECPAWEAASENNPPDWTAFLTGWSAAVDWPAAAFFAELAEAFPDALVLHSVRDSDEWFASTQRTIFATMSERLDSDADDPFTNMLRAVFGNTFTLELNNKDVAVAAYDAHNERVRAVIPASRRLEYTPGDGWEPICNALGLPVPDEPFPHTNSSEDFRATAEAARAGKPPSGLTGE